MAWEWVKANSMDIARFATDEAVQLFSLDESSFDLKREGQFELLLRGIYETLVAQKIKYDSELESTSPLRQRIRTPVEILQQNKQGTCLDLALLFCGLCLGYGLLPKLVMLEGHALAVISLKLQRCEYNSNNKAQKGFLGKRNTDAEGNTRIEPRVFQESEQLKDLVDYGVCCAIECTGFSWSKTINMEKESAGLKRDSEGYFSFEQAIQAGRQQLDRLPLQYAIDIEVAHKSWGIEPEKFAIPSTWQKPDLIVDSEIKVDEFKDSEAVANKFEETPNSGEISGKFEGRKVEGSKIIGNEFGSA